MVINWPPKIINEIEKLFLKESGCLVFSLVKEFGFLKKPNLRLFRLDESCWWSWLIMLRCCCFISLLFYPLEVGSAGTGVSAVELTLHCQMCTSVALSHTSRSFQTNKQLSKYFVAPQNTFFFLFFNKCFLTVFFSETLIFFLPKLIVWSAFYCFMDFSEPAASNLPFFLQHHLGRFWSKGEFQLEAQSQFSEEGNPAQRSLKVGSQGVHGKYAFFHHGIIEFWNWKSSPRSKSAYSPSTNKDAANPSFKCLLPQASQE